MEGNLIDYRGLDRWLFLRFAHPLMQKLSDPVKVTTLPYTVNYKNIRNNTVLAYFYNYYGIQLKRSRKILNIIHGNWFRNTSKESMSCLSTAYKVYKIIQRGKTACSLSSIYHHTPCGTPQSVGLLWTSDQPDTDTSTLLHTSMPPSGLGPHIPSTREAVNLNLRPRCHRD